MEDDQVSQERANPSDPSRSVIDDLVFKRMLNSRALAHVFDRYREPSSARGIIELLITVAPLVLIWILMWASVGTGYWICLLLAVPAAGFVVRLFMI